MKFHPNKLKIIIFAFVILITLVIKRLYDLAKNPTESKNCLFTFPTLTNNSSTLFISTPTWLTQKGGFTNDASCLNKTSIFGMVKITNENDIKTALEFAQKNNLSITPAGQKHSMGGQSFNKNGLVLDMKEFNSIKIDTERKIAHVQSGATWEQLQKKIDPMGLSIKAMQSINIFSIGGTLSVNAHGIAHNPGPVGSTILGMRVMLPDGTIVQTSPTENAELFRNVIGGYGLFGIILDVYIDLVDNEVYNWETKYIPYSEFPNYYKNNIQDKPEIGLFFARLSMSPFSYLSETSVHTFSSVDSQDAIPPLKPIEPAWVQRLIFNISKTGNFGKWLRWNLEKHVAKKLAPCVVSRNNALLDTHECLIARNQAMYDSMHYLKNQLPDTDILQEYFLPPENFVQFVDGLKNIVQTNNANLLNVTIRYVHKDEVSALPYAKKDMFALVLYFNQHLNENESLILQKTTKELIDLAIQQQGTYYLPYQLYYSSEQLKKAYPEINTFFETKNKYDAHHILKNTWFEKYSNNK